MLSADRAQVAELERRLQALRLRALQDAQDVQADRLLRVVEAMLRHTVLKEADSLSGPYAAALDRLVNQVAGSEWKLALEGQPADAAPDEPRFSTWEEVLNKRRQQGQQGQQQQAGGGGSGPAVGAGVADRSYYDLLGVAPTAGLPAIKAAYRQLALRLHPDVSPAPDAAQRFAAVAAAYDVLSDADARALYDRFGPEGMQGRPGAGAGSGNARRAWDEFKPFKRQNKHTRARDASSSSHGSSADEPAAGETIAGGSGAGQWGTADTTQQQNGSASSSSIGSSEGGAGSRGGPADGWAARWARLPGVGAVVEYPLPQVVRDELQDGRSHGVGLLVGRNCDRGDAARLPEGVLDLCEVEPLRQQEPGSTCWVPDELSPGAYVRLAELRPITVDSFDQRFDQWTITAPLSEGCGGPELGEEVIL